MHLTIKCTKGPPNKVFQIPMGKNDHLRTLPQHSTTKFLLSQ